MPDGLPMLPMDVATHLNTTVLNEVADEEFRFAIRQAASQAYARGYQDGALVMTVNQSWDRMTDKEFARQAEKVRGLGGSDA